MKTPWKSPWAALVRVLVLGPAVAATVFVLDLAGTLDRVEWILYDHVARVVRSDKGASPGVAVVLVDDASLQAMEPLVGRWPWPRSVFADLIEFFSMGGARAVVFDILFTERERAGSGGPSPHDLRLVQATAEAGNVYHAMQLVQDSPDEFNSSLLYRPMPEGFAGAFSWPRPRSGVPVVVANNYYLPMEGLWRSARGVGFVDFEPDADGVYRRVAIVREYQGRWFPSLALAPLVDPAESELTVVGRGRIRIGGLEVPVAPDGTCLVNFYGTFDAYSVSGILASLRRIRQGEPESAAVSPYEFEDRIVFVGASAVGLQDLKATPLDNKTPGVVIQASLASNLLEGELLEPAPPHAAPVLAAVFAVLTVGGILVLPGAVGQAAVPLALVGGYGLWALVRLDAGYAYPLAAPGTAVALGCLVGFAYRAATEGRQRRRVRRMFAQYVSPAVLEQILDRVDEALRAEVGETQELTILFSDIRGFTTLAEDLEARQVVEVLNLYFQEMTEAVFRYEGTIDKFIGDALMCFWGAPIHAPDHAERAVRCALAMLARLEDVNRRLRAKGYPEVEIGIGINTGPAVLGNIGSERKLDYTAIGDEVNLASRLEGLNKVYGTPVLVAESTVRQLPPDLPCAVVDKVRVKGKTRPIRIYRPLVGPDPSAEELERARARAAELESAFSAYENRDWSRALMLYERLPQDPVCRVFQERCRYFMEHEPPDDWDGVYTATSK